MNWRQLQAHERMLATLPVRTHYGAMRDPAERRGGDRTKKPAIPTLTKRRK